MKGSFLFYILVFSLCCRVIQCKNDKDKSDKEDKNDKEKSDKEDKSDKDKDNQGWALGKWKQFFVEYGYTSSMSESPKPDEIKAAVTKLRILLRFDPSATDEDIIRFIKLPRCGNPDIKSKSKSKRKRRYDLNPAWRITSFKYAFVKYSLDLPTAEQDRIAAEAFQLWKNAVPALDFTPTQILSEADIQFSFEKSSHPGCTQAFDGTGPIIAHAYLPEDGRVHMDDDETFTDQSGLGTNLYSVMVHEIGHALGLGHSFVTGSVMYPVYQGFNAELTLHEDDINGMRMLYAPDTASNPTCVDTDPSLCAFYHDEGYCTPDFADVMAEICPLTCNLCDV